jgi:hypothetical protein
MQPQFNYFVDTFASLPLRAAIAAGLLIPRSQVRSLPGPLKKSLVIETSSLCRVLWMLRVANARGVNFNQHVTGDNLFVMLP